MHMQDQPSSVCGQRQGGLAGGHCIGVDDRELFAGKGAGQRRFPAKAEAAQDSMASVAMADRGENMGAAYAAILRRENALGQQQELKGDSTLFPKPFEQMQQQQRSSAARGVMAEKKHPRTVHG